jgi:uncharacterized protein YndB with AHSA1/START domain
MNNRTAKSFANIFTGVLILTALHFVAASQAHIKKSVTSDKQKSQIRDLVVTRTFAAPVGKVWKYWAESEYVKQWWSPEGFTTPLARMDFREGGTSLVCMRSPDGQDFYSTWTYRKIVQMELIEYIHNLADKDGKKSDPVKMGMPADFPQGVRNVITFKAIGNNQTEMTVTEYGYTSDQWFELSKLGLNQCLNKMAAALAKN